MNSHKKNAKRALIVMATLGLIGYALFQSKNILLGPILIIDQPKDNATVTYEVVNIKGSAKNIAYIYLNSRQIFVDKSGHFNEKLIVPHGYSIIGLSAIDKFGRKKEKILHIILDKEVNNPSIIEKPNQEEVQTQNQTQ